MNHGDHGEHEQSDTCQQYEELALSADGHMAQVMTYLRLLGLKRAYLLNFNRELLRQRIKRVSI